MISKSIIVGVLLTVTFCTTSSHSQSQTGEQQQIESLEKNAQEFLNQKRPDLAIPQLEAVTRLDPKNVNAQANLGVLLYFRGDYAMALPHLRSATELQPGLTKIEALLGIAEKKTGNPKDARLHLEGSFPNLEKGNFRVEAGMELVELYGADGELESAAEIINQLRREDPVNPEIQYVAYRIYSDLAGESMLSLSLVAPDSAQMHQIMAHEAQRQGNSDAAIAQERAAIRLNSHLPGAHLELAQLLAASTDAKHQNEAEQEYLAALKENPFDERAECGLGKIYAARGDLPQAAKHYSNAVGLQADDAEANSGMAQTLIGLNQPSNALRYLEKAVKLEPTDAYDHYRLSRLYRQEGRIEDAKRELALYQKYRTMKEKLRTLYKDLRLPPEAHQPDKEPSDVNKQEN
jgi:tetratricopeptide (TPR) repeat protein